jgi:hypothetical protein
MHMDGVRIVDRIAQSHPLLLSCCGAILAHGGAAGEPSFSEQACASHAKIRALLQNPTMDIERVNAIGTLLSDLTARTAALRGYL